MLFSVENKGEKDVKAKNKELACQGTENDHCDKSDRYDAVPKLH
jgi:hypothetical protein